MNHPIADSAAVFGGSGGIGAAISEELAVTHEAVLGYHHNHRRADTLLDRISANGGTAIGCGADVTTADAVNESLRAAEGLGPLRTVLHRVGAWDYTRVTDLDENAIDRAYRTNLRSALLTVSAAALRVVDHGRIVMVPSAAAYLAPARSAAYVAIKAGLLGAARVTAKEVARQSVTVNIVRPGDTDTDTPRSSTSRAAIDAMSTADALCRLGTPQRHFAHRCMEVPVAFVVLDVGAR
jgi:3-oxoacyl-[acyl-carrier protein] reductase